MVEPIMALTKDAQRVTTMKPKRACSETPNEKAGSSNINKTSSVLPGTHIVRMSVVGLAGILVNKKYTRNAGRKKAYPRPPSKMRAVVAVSRGQQIKATTPLSKQLSRPNVNGSPEKESSTEKRSRHLALWGSDDNSSLGSLVEFEVSLDKLDISDCHQSTSQYIPKNFELIAALTEDTEHERKVALPIGIANLPINGNSGGEVLALDLPILSLDQAKPLGKDKNGLKGFQMMSIHDKSVRLATDNRRNNFGRLLGRNNVDKIQKVPSIADRKLFSSVYSTDSSGDAILRVQMQVIEKVVHTKRLSPEKATDSPKSAKIRPLDVGSESAATACTESIGSLTSDGSPFDVIFEHKSQRTQSSRTATDAEKPISSSALDVRRTNDDDANLRQSFTSTTEPPTTFSIQGEKRGTRRVGCFEKFSIRGCGPLSYYPDDLTMVTGEIFNREFRFPICTSLKATLDEEDTFIFDTNETFQTYSDLEEKTTQRTRALPDPINDEETKQIQDSNEEIQRVAGVDSLEQIMNGGFSDAERQPKFSSRNFATMPTVPQSINSVSQSSKENQASSRLKRISHKKTNEEGSRKGDRLDHRSVSFVPIFPCTYPSNTGNYGRRMTFGGSTPIDVPENLEIPEVPNSDDLTAITGQDFKPRKVNVRKSTNSRFPGLGNLLIFGGLGMCSNIDLVDDDEVSEGMRLTTTESTMVSSSSNSQAPSEATTSVHENYFEDYDHYSIDRPRSQLSAPPSARKDILV